MFTAGTRVFNVFTGVITTVRNERDGDSTSASDFSPPWQGGAGGVASLFSHGTATRIPSKCRLRHPRPPNFHFAIFNFQFSISYRRSRLPADLPSCRELSLPPAARRLLRRRTGRPGLDAARTPRKG